MITGFEEHTYELTPQEVQLAVPLAAGVLRDAIGPARAIKNDTLRRGINARYPELRMTPSRIRKLIHAIRASHAVPRLIASSRGYYVAQTPEDLSVYITSLQQRISSIEEVERALNNDLQNWNQ